MEKIKEIDFDKVLTAIDLLSKDSNNSDLFNQDTLSKDEQQKRTGLQMAFEQWAGIPFRQFEQYLTIDYGKGKIAASKNSLDNDDQNYKQPVFLKMTTEEYGEAGENLQINYGFSQSPFGSIIIAATDRGICHLSFFKNAEERAFAGLKNRFPNAVFVKQYDAFQQAALDFLSGVNDNPSSLSLHVRGTEYEYKIWESLMKVPAGTLVSYGEIARAIGEPRKAQDVGLALGDNRIAYLIPCHRVIKSTGELGQYHWGARRKAAIIGWEATRG
ncbi:methylated-DNA--[protein]-cysteine S-methyltransferase [Mucilaginibacter sp. cycad4]|uniref:methylated-DNA--[protein]-cysteine S-methyltransferase n=1 Tax=Mucilaginibacter sp. cycad4 TaxID=3342096 RepID=UPI002AAB07C4|nr:methylated-DNA--[protein]-cysteine S-methyltransferase [Mucilaginibacter gossypii]WPV02118.1 methylated-DNA--[protein]-cysteine S-methyltransferase [Mucilaginibacter gossypii]